MRYGHFDDDEAEYVIEKPDTPQSWSNYLGSTEYGAIITNNAGGYGFYKSGAQGRFMRLRFNSVPLDQPGRYFYLRDRDTGDYWSASWQPVGKPLAEYKSVCRHGTAYTVIESEYKGIKSETTYFVPLGQTFEYWRMKITNTGDKPRRLSVFSYCEFSNQWSTEQDLVNLQYSLFIIKGFKALDNMLAISSHDNIHQQHLKNAGNSNATPPGEFDRSAMQSWVALIGSPMTGYDTSREAFIGTYGSYKEPRAVVAGKCSNSDAYGDNACGTVQTEIDIAAGETKEIMLMLGIGDALIDGKKTVEKWGTFERASGALEELKKAWHGKLGSMHVETPDEDINHTVNVWGLYNCLITFAWSRAASLVYNGERDGLGFRDSVQDVLGVSAAIPSEARERLVRMLSGQVSNGGAIPVIKISHNPGHEVPPKKEEFRSDDCQWFFNAVPAYVAETGEWDFYNTVVPYADKGEDTVYAHLKRALLFNLERMGKDGLPAGLLADWNDCLKTGYNGESVFVTFQLRLALTTYADISKRLGKEGEAKWAIEERDKLDKAIQKKCYDAGNGKGKYGDGWFIWAVGEDGTVYGTHSQELDEGRIYLNTQVWAVMSGAATDDEAKNALDAVEKHLSTPYGLMLCAPALRWVDPSVMGAVVFLQGIKENAGIFNHTQGWGIIAECVRGNGDRAYRYCKAALPAAYNDKAEIRQMEPYVQGQTTYSIGPRAGNARTSWLSGAGTWCYYSITQYLLGIRPQYEGMLIDPCIPSKWDGYKVERKWRGKRLYIEVQNPHHVNKGVASLTLNGKEIDAENGAVVPFALLTDGENKIVAVMGSNTVTESRAKFERL